MKPTVKRTELDPSNPNHWMSYGRWLMLTRKGAPKPETTSFLWNDWAANNPTPQAIALAGLDVAGSLSSSLLNPRGILGSAARPVEL